MKVPKRYLKDNPGVFKVVGLSFKPQMTTNNSEDTISIGLKIGDWDDPINFIPYFQCTETNSHHLH